MVLDTQDQALLEFVRLHPKLFVLTGAGCSTASGLGDYRDRSGRWKRRQPVSFQSFMHDLSLRKRYWARSFVGWQAFRMAQPSAAHHALKHLQQQSIAQFLVTQNVDNLHQRAGHTDVIDLHGVLDLVSCTVCDFSVERDTFQKQLLARNHWLAELNATHAPDGDADLETGNLTDMQLPSCELCGAIMKPAVVFFGENVPSERVNRAMTQLHAADAIMVVGSSLMVFSGYRFVRDAAARTQPIVIVNDGITRADELAMLKVSGDCGARLTSLARTLSTQ